jgi:hypothetical protein
MQSGRRAPRIAHEPGSVPPNQPTPLRVLGRQVLALLRTGAPHIRSPRSWGTICALITTTSLHPDATGAAYESLELVACDDALLSLTNFKLWLDTAFAFVDRHAKARWRPRGLCWKPTAHGRPVLHAEKDAQTLLDDCK